MTAKIEIVKDLLSFQLSTRDPLIRMSDLEARGIAERLLRYDPRAVSAKSLTYSKGGRCVLEYATADEPQMTFILTQGAYA